MARDFKRVGYPRCRPFLPLKDHRNEEIPVDVKVKENKYLCIIRNLLLLSCYISLGMMKDGWIGLDFQDDIMKLYSGIICFPCDNSRQAFAWYSLWIGFPRPSRESISDLAGLDLLTTCIIFIAHSPFSLLTLLPLG